MAQFSGISSDRRARNAKVRFKIFQILPKIQDLNLDLKDLSKDLKYKNLFTVQFSSLNYSNCNIIKGELF